MLECPVCGHTASSFRTAGAVVKRPNAICPSCGAFERHRLIAWHVRRLGMLQRGMRVLEVAPTPCLQRLIKDAGGDVVSIDTTPYHGAIQMDIERMTFDDALFDAILCIHVLEHVVDDRRAMRELRRVLRPGGWAVLMVPIRESMPVTDEDPTVTDPAERLRRFGQADHVRYYGADYVDRLASAGFRVQVIAPEDPGLVARHAFLPSEKLYLGWRDA